MRRTKQIGTAIILAGALACVMPWVSRPRPVPPQAPGRSSAEGALSGKVIRVLDGDTIEVLNQDGERRVPERIRMTGIDAPEKSQPFGEFCRKLLAQRVAGSEVRVELRGRDRYGRHLGVVFASPRAEGEVMSAANSSVRTDAESLALDINLAQVQAGCAWHYRQYEKQQKPGERVSYSQAEKKAREARVGLWIDSEPLEPWSFRRERQTSRQSRKKARRSS